MMVIYFFIAICVVSIGAAFTTGILFALSLFGATAIPVVAVAAMKWGILRGDNAQRIGVPIVGVLFLGFSYWLSTGVSLDLFGLHISGLILFVFSGLVGLVGVPLSWAEGPV